MIIPPISSLPLALFPTAILLPMSVADMLWHGKRFSQQLYVVAFLLTYAIVCSKFYYGTDVCIYTAIYDTIESPIEVLKGNSAHEYARFFLFVTSLCKSLHFNFWAYTVLLTTIYFAAIAPLFQKIQKHKVFALFVLCYMDVNLIFFEFRETLSVALIIFAYLSLEKKHYPSFCLLCALSALSHKSAIFCVGIFLIAILLSRKPISKSSYAATIILMISSIVFTLSTIAIFLLKFLPAATSAQASILHHFSYPRRIQTIYVLYVLWGVYLYFHHKDSTSSPFTATLVLIFTLIIAFTYEHWFFIARFRSYFLPIMIVYALNMEGEQTRNKQISSVLLVIVIYLHALIFSRGFWVSNYISTSHINDTSTIFDLRHKTEEQIRRENERKAGLFFKYEYQVDHINQD